MVNPILQTLNKQNNVINQITDLKNMMNGNPGAMYERMMQTNPQFADFVKSNRGKSAEQIAQDYGIDPSILNLLK